MIRSGFKYYSYSFGWSGLVMTVKPIFHCDAQPFALGPRVRSDPQHHNFKLVIPTCWYLITQKLAIPRLMRPLTFANTNPQSEQVEYRWHWVPNPRGWCWPCRFHVVCAHFIGIGYPTRTQFAVEFGLNTFLI